MAESVDHVDVLIVGAGLSGIGAACQITEHLPAQEGRRARGSRGQRRHLGPVQVPRHPLGLRHVHVRLPLASVAQRHRARRRAADPRLPPHGRRGVRRRPADPLPPPRAQRQLGLGDRHLDGRGRPRRRAEDDHHQPAVGLLGLLRLRPGPRAGVPGRRRLRRRDHPPAALARGPRLRRQARGRDRQRRHRGDAGAGDGRHRGPRDDAAALAVVRALPGRARPRGPGARQAADEGLLPGGPLVQHPAGRRLLRRGPAAAGPGEEAPAHCHRQAAARRLRRRPPLQPDLQPVGPATLLRAERRPVPVDPPRAGVGGHRHHRDVHEDRDPAHLGRGARGRHHRHRHRAEDPAVRRHRRSRSTASGPRPPTRWPTRR